MNIMTEWFNNIKQFLLDYNEEVNKYYSEIDKDPEKARKYYEYLYYLESTHLMF